jgi:hypothetical protein
VIVHFVGAEASSADWTAMLRRLLGELGRLGVEVPAPDDPAALRAAFRRGLHVAAHQQARRGGRIVLVIDGLDQLEDFGGGPDLLWLPQTFPDNVRLVVSALPGRALDEARRRGWECVEVGPLSLEARRQMIAGYLGEYGKRLPADELARIANASPAANPLYLRALLEELRVWGVHERLSDRITHYLEASTAAELHQRILARYEEDYERDRPGLVGHAMAYLWAARRGLTEVELQELLGSEAVPLPHALLSPLLLAIDSQTTSRPRRRASAGWTSFRGSSRRRASSVASTTCCAIPSSFLPSPSSKGTSSAATGRCSRRVAIAWSRRTVT